MEVLFSEFKKTSSAEWLKQIEKELNGQPLSNYYLDYGLNESLNPFFSFENKINLIEPDQKNNNSWFIYENVAGNTPFELNQNILIALNGGVNAIEIEIKNTWENKDFISTFKDVFLEYIFLCFKSQLPENEQIEFLEKFRKYIDTHSDKNKINGAFISIKNLEIENLNDYHKLLPNFKFLSFTAKISKTPNKNLSDQLCEIEQILNNSASENEAETYLNSLLFVIELCEDFFLNIATIKAFKIVYCHLLQTYNVKSPIFLKIEITNNTALNENSNLIEATVKALSAVISGVDLIEIKANDLEENQNNRSPARLPRNVQNLLQIESKLKITPDPSNGSYFIDNLTEIIAKKIWGDFLDKVNIVKVI